ncbi:MAG: Methyltransferase domain protein [Candidatus Hydrogenedentes bacterium ADurb.Bin101]|nr:MAG: Methyltransferase domain protein [Candidatus Hydrogenedentes bacterium ADurb.Bin101]
MALLSTFIASQRYAEVTPYIKVNVLELGCQNSLLLGNSNYNISKYYGVEKSTNLVNKLTKQYPDATFLQRDLDRDTLGLDNIFDCVLMVALIEHLYNQKFVFEGVARALKSGGIAAITTPTMLGNDIILPLGASIGLFSKAAVEQHIVVYSRTRFRNIAKTAGLTLKHHHYFQMFCNQIAILEKP